MRAYRSTRGFSLIEVLVALLIFSIGLIGLAGLMVVSVKVNHSAFQRSQASFLAQAMSDRMRANMIGVWGKLYDGSYPVSVGTPCADVCDPANQVTRDQMIWSQEMATMLPNATATIACNGATVLGVDVRTSQRSPYNGTCTITMNWSEQSLDRSTAAATPNTQTFAWVFQP